MLCAFGIFYLVFFFTPSFYHQCCRLFATKFSIHLFVRILLFSAIDDWNLILLPTLIKDSYFSPSTIWGLRVPGTTFFSVRMFSGFLYNMYAVFHLLNRLLKSRSPNSLPKFLIFFQIFRVGCDLIFIDSDSVLQKSCKFFSFMSTYAL